MLNVASSCFDIHFFFSLQTISAKSKEKGQLIKETSNSQLTLKELEHKITKINKDSQEASHKVLFISWQFNSNSLILSLHRKFLERKISKYPTNIGLTNIKGCSYKFALVRACICLEFFSKTSHEIFLELGMYQNLVNIFLFLYILRKKKSINLYFFNYFIYFFSKISCIF